MFDTNPELIIQPYKTGVKLVKAHSQLAKLTTIDELYNMPLLVYFVSHDASTMVGANHLTRITNIPGNQGYYSHTDLKGININKIFHKDTVKMLTHNNKNLIHHTKQMMIYEENGTRLDDFFFGALSFKFPVYNLENKIKGIFGVSVLTQSALLKEIEPWHIALQRLINTGLIKPTVAKNTLLLGKEINETYLSRQEVNCLRLLVTGKTFKLIAQTLKLSPKTVEHYIDNIKLKFNVKIKAELIDKVFQQIFPEIF